ncbi:MAG: YkgJ family cysteine cluster protein [Haloplanus sp.]
MDVHCEGCAGCCIDWRPVAPATLDHERRGRRRPLDDAYNLVPLFGEEVRDFLDAGLGDALTVRLWHAADEGEAVTVDGVDVASVDGRPVFFVGLRKVPKPVAPFGLDRRWLDACVFLDPATLRCRIHGSERYPEACAEYPGRNLELGRETECERVEAAFGGTRLRDDSVPEGLRPPLFGPQALGSRLFLYPDPEELTGRVARAADRSLTTADRAEFVAVAAASSPGTAAVNEERRREARAQVLDASSWVSDVAKAWTARAGEVGDAADDAGEVETARGAPATESW